MGISIIGGSQDTRNNNEDFAITPFLLAVVSTKEVFKIYGIGLCWGWWAIHIGVLLYAPKGTPKFLWFNDLEK